MVESEVGQRFQLREPGRAELPVLAVPFTESGDLDLVGFNAIVTHILNQDVTGITLFGLASEFYKLADGERLALRDMLLEHTAARDDVAAIISVTDHSTELAVRSALSAERAGGDALNVLPPFFLMPDKAAVTAHLAAVLGSVDLPVIVQYAPTQTGTAFTADDFAVLADAHPNLAAVKVESTPPGRMITALGERGVPALVGYAGVQMMDALHRGAVGVQPGCSLIEAYLDIWHFWHAGDQHSAREVHQELLPYITYWMQSVELIIQAEKTVLARRGLISSDRCRKPTYALDHAEIAYVDRAVDRFSTSR